MIDPRLSQNYPGSGPCSSDCIGRGQAPTRIDRRRSLL